MITLYGVPRSRSLRVLWALEELELPYEYLEVDLARRRAGEQRLEKLNPACKGPILRDDDFLLTESAAICLYLAERDVQQRLLPPNEPRARARLQQWCSFAISELEQPLWTNAKHSFALPRKLRVPAVRETARYEFEHALKVLEKGLAQQEWILGDRFSVADILIANTLGWAEAAEWPPQSESLIGYLRRAERRSALDRALTRETTPSSPAA